MPNNPPPFEVTQEQLDSIRILFCAPDTCAIYGIPYDMRRDVGQEPRHLWQAGNTKGWIYLGGAGWFGNMSRASVGRVKAFLAAQEAADNVPGYPYEWCRIQNSL
jgi:hypothetical protein